MAISKQRDLKPWDPKAGFLPDFLDVSMIKLDQSEAACALCTMQAKIQARLIITKMMKK